MIITSEIKRYLRFIVLAFILCFVDQKYLFSQDSLRSKKVKILPVPTVGYSPETKTYFGMVTLFSFDIYRDSISRKSNAKIEFNYTWNKQIIINADWNLFSKKEKRFSKGQIHYSRFPDLYFGIGSNTTEDNRITFNSSRHIIDVNSLKKRANQFFSGFNIKYISYYKVDPAFNSNTFYSELLDRSTFGLGYSILRDSRNNILTPRSGLYALINSTYNFSETNYLELFTDIRLYKTWYDKNTISFRYFQDINIGNPPFFDYAILGGDRFVRGYYLGRFRDKNINSLQSEYRIMCFPRIGLASFGGVSFLFNNLSKVSSDQIKLNVGLGIRVMVDKKDKTNLRLDYAIGNNKSNGFYISFGESF